MFLVRILLNYFNQKNQPENQKVRAFKKTQTSNFVIIGEMLQLHGLK